MVLNIKRHGVTGHFVRGGKPISGYTPMQAMDGLLGTGALYCWGNETNYVPVMSDSLGPPSGIMSGIWPIGDQLHIDLVTAHHVLQNLDLQDSTPGEGARRRLMAALAATAEELEAFSATAGQSLSDLADASIDSAAEGEAIPPVHPGEILLEEFIRPAGLSPIRTARLLGVPRTRLERLVTGETSMTVDTALRLEALFGAAAEFWMDLQSRHDLARARQTPDATISAIQRWDTELAKEASAPPKR